MISSWCLAPWIFFHALMKPFMWTSHLANSKFSCQLIFKLFYAMTSINKSTHHRSHLSTPGPYPPAPLLPTLHPRNTLPLLFSEKIFLLVRAGKKAPWSHECYFTIAKNISKTVTQYPDYLKGFTRCLLLYLEVLSFSGLQPFLFLPICFI